MNRRSLSQVSFASLLLAMGLSITVVGCDSAGSNPGDQPEWVGNWEAVDAKPDSIEFPVEGGRILFSLTTDSIKTYSKFQDSECDIDAAEIDNFDGDLITVIGEEDEADPDTSKIRLKTSSGRLTIAPVDPEEGVAEARVTEIIAEPLGSDPASILSCSESGTNAQLRQRIPWER